MQALSYQDVSPMRQFAYGQAQLAAQSRQDRYMIERIEREVAVIRQRRLIRSLRTRKMIAAFAIMLTVVSFAIGWMVRGAGSVKREAHQVQISAPATPIADATPTAPASSNTSALAAPLPTSTASSNMTTQTTQVLASPGSLSAAISVQSSPQQSTVSLKQPVPAPPSKMGTPESAAASRQIPYVDPIARIAQHSNSTAKTIQIPVQQQSKPADQPIKGGVDVDLSTPSNAQGNRLVNAPPQAKGNVVMAEGGVLTIREGAKVTSYRVGDKLPDGSTLMSAEGGEYKVNR